MGNKEYAQEACDFARAQLKLKSSNKMKPKVTASVTRQKAAGKVVNFAMPGLIDPETDAEYALKVSAGNCYHLAAIAKRFLVHKYTKKLACVIVKLMDHGDHLFLAVGLPDGGDQLPTNMHSWGDDVYICDPWANIVSTANAYARSFLQKMHKWHSDGKQIFYQKRWVDPLDAQWLNSITQCRKETVLWDY